MFFALERPRFSPALAVAALVGSCAVGGVSAAELDRLAQVLHLEPGTHVADVGAGAGKWSVMMARRVGQEGHVWATEVDEDEVEKIEARVLEEGLDNVSAVLGTQQDTGLPDACCDAILLRMVYHHFTHPEQMRASLRRALRSGGLIAVIDIEPQESWRDLPDVPDRGGHGIPAEELVLEMTVDGFEVVSRIDDWNSDEDRYCIVFRR